jgi:formate dehydrogenase subunit gamma
MTAHPPLAHSIEPLLTQYAYQPERLLPLLHDIQDLYGYVPEECVQPIAEALNISRADVHGVLTFYHHFRQQPPADQVLQVCMGEACQACGSSALLRDIQAHADAHPHLVSGPHQGVSIEPVYCLGLCANSPAAMLDERLMAEVTLPQLVEAIDANLPQGRQTANRRRGA